MLKLLLVKAPQFQDIQTKILKSFEKRVSLQELLPHGDLCLKLIQENEDFRSYFVEVVGRNFDGDCDIDVIDNLAELLCKIVFNCDKNIATNVLENIDNCIETPFYKDEVRNCLIVKIDEHNRNKI